MLLPCLFYLPFPIQRVRASARRLKTGMSASRRSRHLSTQRHRGALQTGASRPTCLRPDRARIPQRGGIEARTGPGGCCGIGAATDAGTRIVPAEPRSFDEAADGARVGPGGCCGIGAAEYVGTGRNVPREKPTLDGRATKCLHSSSSFDSPSGLIGWQIIIVTSITIERGYKYPRDR